MLKVRTLTVEIARPAQDVYNFLVRPLNLSQWTLVKNGRLDPAGADRWRFDGSRGEIVVHFTPPNAFMVVDYTLELGGEVFHAAAARVIPKADGCVLTHTSVQQPGVSDSAFASEEEWMMSDLLVLKTLMEGMATRS